MPRRPIKEGDSILSDRQKQVLQLVYDGMSRRQIAEILFIAKRTVDFHLGEIYDRLCVRGMIAACQKAVRLGLLDVSIASDDGNSTPDLSKRQIEVLCMMANSLPAKDTGVGLHINQRTVEYYNRIICSKFGVRFIRQAVSLAIRDNLIPPPSTG